MSVQNFSFLARLEVAEKFVVGWGWGGVVVVGWGGEKVGWWWSRPSLGFSFSQAEQKCVGGEGGWWGTNIEFCCFFF